MKTRRRREPFVVEAKDTFLRLASPFSSAILPQYTASAAVPLDRWSSLNRDNTLLHLLFSFANFLRPSSTPLSLLRSFRLGDTTRRICLTPAASMAEIQAMLLDVLSNLDPDANPYDAIRSYFRLQFLPNVSAAGIGQLYAIIALLSLYVVVLRFLFPFLFSIFLILLSLFPSSRCSTVHLAEHRFHLAALVFSSPSPSSSAGGKDFFGSFGFSVRRTSSSALIRQYRGH
jgi:hypothetical protein